MNCYIPKIRRGVRGCVLPKKRQDGSLGAGLICDVDGPWVRYMRLCNGFVEGEVIVSVTVFSGAYSKC